MPFNPFPRDGKGSRTAKLSALLGCTVTIIYMLSLEKCAEVLKEGNITLENDVLKELRDYLYLLAGLQVEAENNGLNGNGDEEGHTVL